MPSQVSINQSPSIDQSITESLQALGDLSDILCNKHIAIKPNDTWASVKDTTACTQPESLRATIQYLNGFAPASITVMGGSGADTTSAVFRYTGLDRVVSEEKASFLDLNQEPYAAVPHVSG